MNLKVFGLRDKEWNKDEYKDFPSYLLKYMLNIIIRGSLT